MRRPLSPMALLLATAACGQSEPRNSSSPMMVHDAMPAVNYQPVPPRPVADSESAGRSAIDVPGAPPEIAPTAAPGVAFNYRYAFRLRADQIGALQEAHAQACERLTVARCRITAMLYRLAGPDRIEARLELKLDPEIARRFGRESGEAVARAGGLLTESEISGVDVGGAIETAGRDIAALTADLARIEARLRGLRNDSPERPTLDFQVERLRARIAALRDGSEAQQESLATTPMVFQYQADGAAAGTGERQTVAEAAAHAGDNFLGGVNILLIVLVTLLPWAFAALIAAAAFRFARKRWFPPPPMDEDN